jgi:hypothetical protein
VRGAYGRSRWPDLGQGPDLGLEGLLLVASFLGVIVQTQGVCEARRVGDMVVMFVGCLLPLPLASAFFVCVPCSIKVVDFA